MDLSRLADALIFERPGRQHYQETLQEEGAAVPFISLVPGNKNETKAEKKNGLYLPA